MPDKLFLVHGMGNHQDDWAEPVVELLRDIYSRYRVSKLVSFDERFKVVPIRYDSIFRDTVQRWQQDASAVGQLADGVGADEVNTLVGWLRNAQVDENFAWTHAADVLLYRLFFDVRQAVKVRVARQIAEEIVDLRTNESWSVIAHSLGTAVAHDALDMLWRGQAPGVPPAFSPAQGKAQMVMMVSNVSRLLQTVPKAYESLVKPGAANQPDRGCFQFLNVRHRFDPFTFPRRFDPQAWPDSQTVAAGRYANLEVEHFHQANVHDLVHYLKHPAVHIPMLRKATFERAVLKEEETAALDAFDPFGGDTNRALALRQELEDRLPAISDDWRRLRAIWDAFFGDFLGLP